MLQKIGEPTKVGIFHGDMGVDPTGLRFFRFTEIEIRFWEGRAFIPLRCLLSSHEWDNASAELRLTVDLPQKQPSVTIAGQKLSPGTSLLIILTGTAPRQYTLKEIRVIE